MRNNGFLGNRAGDGVGVGDPINIYNESNYHIPKIDSYTVTDTSFVPTGATALDVAGNETVVITGSGFTSGVVVRIGTTTVNIVNYISPTKISITTPALTAGTYMLMVYNSSGGAGVLIPGIQYSTVTSFNVTGSLGTYYETGSTLTPVMATSDSTITYTLLSGSLPPGASIDQTTGRITGSVPVTTSVTTYTFTIKATDAEGQFSTRTFNITYSIDVVTWNAPSNNSNYTAISGQGINPIALSATSAGGNSVSYSANQLPPGISIVGNNITGILNTTTNSLLSTTLIATAASSNRIAPLVINWTLIYGDLYWYETVLAMTGEIDTIPFIADTSTNAFEVTVLGETAAHKFNPYMEGYYSNYFDGSSQYYIANNAAFEFGTGDFTIEAWVYPTNFGNSGLVFFSLFQTPSSGRFIAFLGPTGVQMDTAAGLAISFSGTIPCSTHDWYHCVVARTGGVFKTYVNGQVCATGGSVATMSPTGQALYFGDYSDGYSTANGFISNLRVIKGQAIYTGVFSPPTDALTTSTIGTSGVNVAASLSGTVAVLTARSNRPRDLSLNNFALNIVSVPQISSNTPFRSISWDVSDYGSAYFDGNGDTIDLPSGLTNFQFGTGDLTIEFWVYPTTAPTTSWNPFMTLGFSGGGLEFRISQNINGTGYGVLFPNNSSNADTYQGFGTLQLWQWHHIALVRSGSNMLFFRNGILINTWTGVTFNHTNSTLVRIGGSQAAYSDGNFPGGWISNIRIVKGTAVYTSAFPNSVPVVPLTTATTGTQFLSLQYAGPANNNGIVDRGPMSFPITNSGGTGGSLSSTISPYQPGGWSCYYNRTAGTGAAIQISGSTALPLGTDFTVEFYAMRVTYSSGAATLVLFSGSVNLFSITASNAASTSALGSMSIASATLNPTVYAAVGQWFHVAVSRTGSSTFMHINGTQYATGSDAGTYSLLGNMIGGSGGSTEWLGYVSNFRVSVGSVAYGLGTTFVPSVTPLVATTNTAMLLNGPTLDDWGIYNMPIVPAGTTTPSMQPISPFSGTLTTPVNYSTVFGFTQTGNYVIIPYGTNVDILSTDFTIECRVYFTAISGLRAIIAQWNQNSGSGHWLLGANGTSLIFYFGAYSEGGPIITGSPTIVINRWYHLAVTRIGSTFTMYLDGQSVGTGSSAATRASPTVNITIGNYYSTSGTLPASGATDFIGAITNVRIVRGLGVYTGNFTVPTGPLTVTQIANPFGGINTQAITTQTGLLTCNSSTIVNLANTATIITQGATKQSPISIFGFSTSTKVQYSGPSIGGSGYFNGYYVETNVSHNSHILYADFTIEGWAMWTSAIGGYQSIFEIGAYPDTLLFRPSGGDSVYLNGTNYGDVSSWFKLNYWTHWALTRSNGKFTIWINGQARLTNASASGTLNSPGSPLRLASSRHSGGQNFPGYLSNVRFINGRCLYNAAFTPPTTAVQSTTGTVLLFNFDNNGIRESTGRHFLATNSNARISNKITKFGNSSLYFPGATYYTYMPLSSGMFDIGTGDVTIECWFYIPTGTTQLAAANLFNFYNGSAYGIIVHTNVTSYANKLTFWCDTYGAGPFITGTTTLTTGTWYHFLLSRSGGIWRMFLNGAQEGSSYTNAAAPDQAYQLYIGGNAVSTRQFTGYIDEFRFTRFIARSTSTFAVPTLAMVTR
jgi:hypothetical protein